MTSPAQWSQHRLGYRFEREELLEQALTHRSAARVHNERLEFLGDAVLDLVIAAALFELRPESDEGALSRYRARLVRRDTLAEIARALELAQHVVLGPGEMRGGGQQRKSTLANCLEALYGAVYLDGGFEAAAGVIRRHYAQRLAQLPDEESLKDPKTRLQEWLQAREGRLPEYSVVKVSGKDHAQTFRVVCRISEPPCEASGEGSSRRRAEQEAARHALQALAGLPAAGARADG